MMKESFKSLALCAAILVGVQGYSPQAEALYVTPPAAAGAGGSTAAGTFIVAGVAVSAVSLIFCAMIIGSRFNREMTLQEVAMSGLIPLGCLIRNSGPGGQ